MKQESDSAESKKDSRKSRPKKKSSDGQKDPNDSLTEIVTRMRKLSLQENSTPEKTKQPSQDEATSKVASSCNAPSSGDTAPSGNASPEDVLSSGDALPDASPEDVTETNLTAVDMSLTFMESPDESFNTTTTLSSMDETFTAEPRYVFDPSCEENIGKKNDFFPVFNTMTLMKDEHFSNPPLGHTSSLFSLNTPLFDTVPIGSACSMPDFIPMPPVRVPMDPKNLEKEEAVEKEEDVEKEEAAKKAEEHLAKAVAERAKLTADLSADAAQEGPSQQNCDESTAPKQ